VAQRLQRLIGIALWVGGGSLAVGAIFVVSFFTAVRFGMRGTEVEVPDLTGLPLEAARQRMATADLVPEVVDQRHDPRVASGSVLEQMPQPEARVRRGRKVKLVLSLGGKVLTVPTVVGGAARTVAIELRQAGFIPGDEARVHSRELEPGKVLAQVPPAGSSVVPGSRVHRLVSAGARPAAWTMVDLTGKSRREAERWIENSGFRKGGVRHVPAGGLAPGTVVAQSPEAGYPVRARDIVELSVAE
jgi:serine/threonine-protein kinase